MLLKLIKNEISCTKNVIKTMYQGYCFLILSTIIFTMLCNGQNIFMQNEITSTSDMFLLIFYSITQSFFVIYSVGMVIMGIIYSCFRFYNNILYDEGYVMMCLPITSKCQLLSKFITTIMWIKITIILIVIATFLLTITNNSMTFIEIVTNMFTPLINDFNLFMATVIIALLLFSLLTYVILMIYTGISIGSSRFKNHLAGSITSILIVLITSIILFFIATGIINYGLYPQSAILISSNTIHPIIVMMFVALIVINTISFILFNITNHYLTKKLNLQ